MRLILPDFYRQFHFSVEYKAATSFLQYDNKPSFKGSCRLTGGSIATTARLLFHGQFQRLNVRVDSPGHLFRRQVGIKGE